MIIGKMMPFHNEHTQTNRAGAFLQSFNPASSNDETRHGFETMGIRSIQTPRNGVRLLIFVFVAYLVYSIYSTFTDKPAWQQLDYELVVNKSFMGRDNICFVAGKPIFLKELPIMGHLPKTEHCEYIYDLGSYDYVYACEYEGKASIVFKTFRSWNLTSIDTGLNLKQFCALLYLAPNLLDDIEFILNKT